MLGLHGGHVEPARPTLGTQWLRVVTVRSCFGPDLRTCRKPEPARRLHGRKIAAEVGTSATPISAPRAAGFGCVRLRPRVRGTDGSGLAARDNPQEAPKKDEFRRRCQRPTDRGRLRRQIQARQVSCSVVFRGAMGKEKGRLESLSSTTLDFSNVRRKA